MALLGRRAWASLLRWRAATFVVGGSMFAVAAVLALLQVVAGVDRPGRLAGQAFVAAGWAATSVGLVGLYPGLARRSRWLARAGVLLATVAAVGFAAVGATTSLYYAGVPEGTFTERLPLLLPVILFGVLLPFPTFAVACLRSAAHPRALGVLLLAPPAFFVGDYVTPDPPAIALVVAGATALVHFAIGRLLLSGQVPRRGRGVASRQGDDGDRS